MWAYSLLRQPALVGWGGERQVALARGHIGNRAASRSVYLFEGRNVLCAILWTGALTAWEALNADQMAGKQDLLLDRLIDPLG
jgi:hypothetical protein